MLPASPDTYEQYTSRMQHRERYRVGAFTYDVGDIDGVAVVLSSPPPIGSFSMTAIDTYLMEQVFHPRILIDPGTAGSHLPLLSMGDVVIGARVVNFSNYMSRADGTIVPGQFTALVSDHEGYADGNPNPEYLYSDPQLVHMAYSAAQEVAKYTPALILHGKVGRKPWIMEYGTQGSGAAWLRNVRAIKESTTIFHEVDEAGNYPIALVSTINRTPFVEIHTISDAAINVPTKMDKYFHQCSVYAQDRSNRIALAMIAQLAAKTYDNTLAFFGGNRDPYPPGSFSASAVAPNYVQDWTRANGIHR
ncbi:hypothetical protein AB4090_12260 [Acidithiobacillus sp. IBUN Pt1247-S3]|uniref:phosphorylase family protein n=1 Tax=Acidithiobacillus sp. IBUN Pt1247-S3 TaxID=3166642 RepID=UPI0034E412A7